MSGFGSNERKTKKSEEKKIRTLQRDKLISNALSLHSSGKIKHAADVYNFLIQSKIYDPRVFNNLGSIYSNLKQFDKAILLFDESIKKFPNSLEAYPNLASVLVAKGRSDIAKKILNKSIEINPNYLKAYQCLSEIICEYKFIFPNDINLKILKNTILIQSRTQVFLQTYKHN